MKVLYYEVGKEPIMKEIENTLDAIQDLVGGMAEQVYIKQEYVALVNEEGAINGMAYNRDVRGCPIYGNFFICKMAGEDFAGMTDRDVDRVMPVISK